LLAEQSCRERKGEGSGEDRAWKERSRVPPPQSIPNMDIDLIKKYSYASCNLRFPGTGPVTDTVRAPGKSIRLVMRA